MQAKSSGFFRFDGLDPSGSGMATDLNFEIEKGWQVLHLYIEDDTIMGRVRPLSLNWTGKRLKWHSTKNPEHVNRRCPDYSIRAFL